MKFLDFDRVLCLSPHPDDVEYSMAGTVLKYSDTHFDILCLTQGGDCDSTSGLDRIREVESSWNESKTTNFSLQFTPYKYLKELEEDQWVSYIENNYTCKQRFDCIFLPSREDSHFEHRFVSRLGWPLSRITPISIVEYCSPSTLETWVPNIFVNIENQYNVKLKMLEKFDSQQHRPYFSKEIIKGFHNNFQCSKKGIPIVEQFRSNQVFLK